MGTTMKREDLEVKELLNGDGFGYPKEAADKVMDAMEAALKNKQRCLDKLISENYELRCKLREYETCGTFKEMCKSIKELESQLPKWISVKDRLPEDGACVLCSNGFGVQSIAIYSNRLGFYNDGDDVWVTHWQPLPPPPTTEEK